MPGRLPFHYGSGCSGPAVSIGDIPFLPICSFPAYVQPTLALLHVDMTLPDLAPPPLCPCIFTVKAKPFSIHYPGYIGNPGASGSLIFKPSMPMNCCEPTFKMSGKLNLPCMPFAVSAFCRINVGSMHCTLVKLSHCHLKFSTYISLPNTFSCIPFSFKRTFSVTPAGALKGFTFGKNPAKPCQLLWSAKISLPNTFSCIPFSFKRTFTIVPSGRGRVVGITFGKNPSKPCQIEWSAKISLPCVPFSISRTLRITGVGAVKGFTFGKTDCHLKFSALISMPCMAFVVDNGSDTINIGTFSFVLSAVPASCKLKQHGKISLPCTWVTAVNSVSYVAGNFLYHYHMVKVFTFQAVQQIQWATAEPCPSV